MTIEQLLTEQNDYLRRIAEGVERLVVLGEKQAGVLPEAPEVRMAAPLEGGGKYHVLYPHGARPSAQVCCRSEIAARRGPDASALKPAHLVPQAQRCRHDGCRRVYALADNAATT